MGFLVDENLPTRLALELSALGFPSQRVSDIPALRSAPDDEFVAHAARERLVLITRDKELSFLTRLPDASRTGVVSARIKDRLSIDEQLRILGSAIASLGPSEFTGGIVVVEPGRVRPRRRK